MFAGLIDKVQIQVLTKIGTCFGLLLCAAPGMAQAQEESARAIGSAGDTAWVLTSSVLVLMMVAPGLALFYGGLGTPQERAGHPGCRASFCWP